MSDNGEKEIVLVRVILKGGKMSVECAGGHNLALFSHAAKLVNLEVDNMIIGNEVNEAPKPKMLIPGVVPQGVLNKILRGGK